MLEQALDDHRRDTGLALVMSETEMMSPLAIDNYLTSFALPYFATKLNFEDAEKSLNSMKQVAPVRTLIQGIHFVNGIKQEEAAWQCRNTKFEKISGRLQRTDMGKVREPYGWKVINEEFSPDVVRQKHELSCVSACGEMITNGDLVAIARRMGSFF